MHHLNSSWILYYISVSFYYSLGCSMIIIEPFSIPPHSSLTASMLLIGTSIHSIRSLICHITHTVYPHIAPLADFIPFSLIIDLSLKKLLCCCLYLIGAELYLKSSPRFHPETSTIASASFPFHLWNETFGIIVFCVSSDHAHTFFPNMNPNVFKSISKHFLCGFQALLPPVMDRQNVSWMPL